MPASRSVVSMLLRELGDFSLHPQGRPCGRPPPAAVLGPSDALLSNEVRWRRSELTQQGIALRIIHERQVIEMVNGSNYSHMQSLGDGFNPRECVDRVRRIRNRMRDKGRWH